MVEFTLPNDTHVTEGKACPETVEARTLRQDRRNRSFCVFAIRFDLDAGLLEQLHPDGDWQTAYADLRSFLSAHGFRMMRGGLYVGDPETINAVTCDTIAQTLTAKFEWFKPSLRDIRMLQITDDNDLMPAVRLAIQMKEDREAARA